MIAIPATSTLEPQRMLLGNGLQVFLLPASSTDLVRLDIIDEAGSAYQPQPLCSAAALKLHTVASLRRNAYEVAEWFDYRGAVLENSPGIFSCSTTVYTLSRFATELIPLMSELRSSPAFPVDEFTLYCNKRKQEIMANLLKSREVARNAFYVALFGADHPLGRFATPDDADRLQLDTVKHFYDSYYMKGNSPTVLISGHVDNGLVEALGRLPIHNGNSKEDRIAVDPSDAIRDAVGTLVKPIAGSVQTTVRVGRVLPLEWHSMDYARLTLLVNLLGGYFGSRLMTNLREEKGLTYGIYARTQLYRGCIVFYIVADVAAGTAQQAVDEIRHELQQLCDTRVSDDELQLVKTVTTGDFIRSVDGIFERAERLSGMLQADVDERLTDNLRQAIADTTPDHLRQLACQWLHPDSMLYVLAGA